MRKLILLFLLTLPSFATKTMTSSVAFTDAQGNVCANCTIIFQLNQSAKIIAGGQINPMPPIKMTLTAGGLVPAAFTMLANDELQPTGTTYIVNIYSSSGLKVRGPENWILSGASPIDLSTITNSVLPDPGLASPVLQNPSAAQTITGFGLTFTNTAPVTFQGTTTFSGAQTFNNPTITGGIAHGGSGFQHVRSSGCTTGTSQFNSCSVTVNWPSAWADINYTAVCVIQDVGGSAVGTLMFTHNVTTTTIPVTVVKLDSGGLAFVANTIDCIGVHD